MATAPPSTALRKQLRQRILDRIEELHLTEAEAAERLGFTASQMSRLLDNEDIFSLDRLINAAAGVGLSVRMTATRPYRND